MATYYVSKSGNDANAGTSWALSKLTIQAATNLATGTDTINVGSGSYNENISRSLTGTGNWLLTYVAYGHVQIDGNATAGSAFRFQTPGANGQALSLTFTTDSSLGGAWTFRNFSNTIIYLPQVPAQQNRVICNKCTFIGNGSNIGVRSDAGSNEYRHSMQFYDCVFRNNPTAIYMGKSGQNGGSWSNEIIVIRCTFTGNTNYSIFKDSHAAGQNVTAVITNNIFKGSTTSIYSGNRMTISGLDKNDYYNTTNLLYLSSTNYTTLADVQALGYEGNGLNVDPTLIDEANEVFFVTSDISGNGTQIGRYAYSPATYYTSDSNWNITGTADNSGYYNPDGNITENGTTHFFELTAGTSGVLYTPVYDLGSVKTIDETNLSDILVWPTNMIDTTTSDTLPNYQTIEIRGASSSFAQDNGTIAWSEIRYGMPIPTFSGRYVQLRLTFRTDDVAA